MSFDDVKHDITTHFDLLKSILPAYNYEAVLTEMIGDIEMAINETVELPSELDPNYRQDINSLLDGLVEYLACQKLSENELALMNCISLLYSNFLSIYPQALDRSYLYKVFSILIDTHRSLSDMLSVNLFLASKLKAMAVSGCANNELSSKYLYEYERFLKGKDHDGNYSLNHC